MKYLYLLFTIFFTIHLNAQTKIMRSVTTSYFGESVTNPGVKIGLNLNVSVRKENETRKDSSQSTIYRGVVLSPNVGFLRSNKSKTARFLSSELSYTRKTNQGKSVAFGFGLGYMQTIFNNVYSIDLNDQIQEKRTTNNSLLTNCFLVYSRDLSNTSPLPIEIFLKPQILYTLNHSSNNELHFALEIGVNFLMNHLKQDY